MHIRRKNFGGDVDIIVISTPNFAGTYPPSPETDATDRAIHRAAKRLEVSK